MNSSKLRQFWSVVEGTHAGILLKLNDHELVHQLIRQLEDSDWFTAEETATVSNYIRSKVSLVRDLAEARLA